MTSPFQRVYQGERLEAVGGCAVTVDGTPLLERFDLRNHSPDGFNWGYGGSGPAQLALALLADALNDDDAALEYYQKFKFEVIARLQGDSWLMTESCIKAWFVSDPLRVAYLQRN